MENAFYEIRPYLFLIIALYAFTNANEFVGFACGTLLAAVSIHVIRARYYYRVVKTN